MQWRKIKCFFKKCDNVEDPTGYVIGKQRELATRKNKVHGESKKKQKLLQGGGMRFTRNKRKYKYMKYIPKKVKKAMKKSMKKEETEEDEEEEDETSESEEKPQKKMAMKSMKMAVRVFVGHLHEVGQQRMVLGFLLKRVKDLLNCI